MNGSMRMATELFKVVAPDAALKNLLANGLPEPRVAVVPIGEAAGRVVGRDVRAPEPSPAFNRSTMDGYAVHASDTFGATESLPAYLSVVGEVPMGESAEHGVSASEALLIHTGGMLPEGADAVVMVEHTQQLGGGTIEVVRPVAPGDSTIRRGDDVAEGDIFLQRGRRLRAPDVGGLAALGISKVPVAIAPVVGVIATGDEVIPPESMPEPGEIRDVNSSTIVVEVERAGGVARPYGIVSDDRKALRATVEGARQQCDVVIITAGSSVSARDLTAEVIGSLGPPGILAHGLALKPGKPTIIAMAGDTPVFGLPGNPVSALVVFDLLVAPTIRRLQGMHIEGERSQVQALLARSISSAAGRLDFVPAQVFERAGASWAEPIFGASNMIFTLVRADALIRVPADANGLPAGAKVDIRFLT